MNQRKGFELELAQSCVYDETISHSGFGAFCSVVAAEHPRRI